MQLFKAAVCQLLACTVAVILGIGLSQRGVDYRYAVLLQPIMAATLSGILRQPVWWRPIHLFFMPAVWIALDFDLPSWLYLLIFLLLLLVFWGTVKGDVPLFLSSSAAGEALATLLRHEKAARFADIGAGIGTVVVRIARQFPELGIDALERAPLPWLATRLRCRGMPNVSVRRGSFWLSHLGEYDVVFAFLSPSVMERVGEKVRQEMRDGRLFISSSFPVPAWRPEKVVILDDGQNTRLYCYRIRRTTLTPE